MNLTIRNVSASDFGTYTCIAKNSLGETDGTIKLEGNKQTPQQDDLKKKLFYRNNPASNLKTQNGDHHSSCNC